MNFIKHYWFGLLSSSILFLGFLLFLLVLVSPRQDVQGRGFIPCTQAMADGMISCPKNRQYRCMFGYILENSWCDIKVVGRGLKFWVKREQKAPWSNFIFVPELPTDPNAQEDEVLQEFYENNPDFKFDMNQLKNLNDSLEKKVDLEKKVEEEKNNGKK